MKYKFHAVVADRTVHEKAKSSISNDGVERFSSMLLRPVEPQPEIAEKTFPLST